MKRIVALVCMLAALVGLGAMVMTHSLAAPPKKGENLNTKGVQGKTRGENPNVKNEHEMNDRTAKPKAPRSKGGTATRGSSTGIFHVDNHTGWYVKIYVDGDYVGTVGPYGDLYRTADVASYTVLGIARFEDSDDLTFGPSKLRVYGDSTSTWTLTD